MTQAGHIGDRAGLFASLARDDPQRQEAEAHARQCSACQAALREAVGVMGLLDTLPPREPSVELLATVRARIDDDTRAERTQPLRATVPWDGDAMVADARGAGEPGHSHEGTPLGAPSSPASPTGSQRLAGRYELLSLVGAGGMGAVYRATDVELDETVALKMVRMDLVKDPRVVARFRQEVKLARRVTHHNVARTFDIGEHGGARFLTMEFIDGESLAMLIARRGRIPLREVVTLTEAICAGLSAAHAAGVIHGDLKPGNVLLARDGRVVLTDFGLALALGDRDREAVGAPGSLVGTPAFMAPEQVLGSRHLDARVDIYSLGVMIYVLLTGERPWQGEADLEVASKRLVEPPPDPRLAHGDLPDAVAQVTQRCMARDPEDRFHTASEVAAALAACTVSLQAPGSIPPGRAAEAGRASSRAADAKTVAVLPFRNGGPREDDYLADGLTDDLVDNLSMAPGLRVRPWRGASADGPRDPRELGESLGVQVVVEGVVHRDGDHVRVNARVLSVADGFQLWARRFDFEMGELLAVGQRMVVAIAQALTVESRAPERETSNDPVAVASYLRARHEYHRGWQSLGVAIDLFKQALDRSPDNPMVLSGYAMALARRFAHDDAKDEDASLGRAAAERALAVAPHLGEARIALAGSMLTLGECIEAAREVRLAIRSSPGLGDAHDLYGRMLVEAGALEEGVAYLRTALAFEPRLHVAKASLARTLSLLGRHDEAEAIFSQALGEPDAPPLYWINRVRLAFSRRDHARATEWLVALGPTGNAPPPVLELLNVLADQSISTEARGRLRAMATLLASPRMRAFFSQLGAEVSSFVGDTAAMWDYLVAADAAGVFDLPWLERGPLFEGLREDPRYVLIHRRVAERASAVREALGAVALVE